MVYRFNPPANWPTPPAGWTPDAGWRPDPAWGPLPEGWPLWVETSEATPTPRKSRVGLIIGVIAGLLVIGLVVTGAVALVTFLSTPLSAVDIEGVEPPRTVEEAKANLQGAYDEAIDYLETHHGFYKTFVRADLDEALAEGNEQTGIDFVELRTLDIMGTHERMIADAEAWEEAWGGPPAFTDNSTGTDLEAILDGYTGGTVDFAIDSLCGTATACVQQSDPNLVHVNELYLDNPAYVPANYADVLLHEYGHVTQMKYTMELEASADWESLFDSDVEFHADCMALSLKPDFITAYGSVCTPEHLASAKNAWDGVFAE